MMWNFKTYGDNIAAITDQGERITYSQLNMAGEELFLMIRERCLVFLLSTNSIGSLIGYTAFLNHKIVPLLLDSRMDYELLLNLMETYRPKYLWIPDLLVQQFADCRHTCQKVCQKSGYTLISTGYEEGYPLYPELALLMTTSGSTGSPKLVRQSYDNIKANYHSIVQYLELDDMERPITTLPMNYTYGLSIINSHLAVGAALLMTELTLMDRAFWNFFQSEKATSFGGVPYTYEILNKLRFFHMELPSLRTMTQAGGRLSPELHRRFAEYAMDHGKHFIVMYGQTEATARMSYLPNDKSLEKCGSMGIAIPGGSFSLIDEDGSIINEPETVGELVYEGPNVTLGYAQCGRDLMKGDERSGRLVTGDMARRDSDGYYYIVGRKKRFLKLYGNRVNLDEAEALLKARYTESDCACTGNDDKMYLFITDEHIKEEVKKYMSEKTGLNQSAFHVTVIDQIPKNEAGKTLYSRLEELCQ